MVALSQLWLHAERLAVSRRSVIRWLAGAQERLSPMTNEDAVDGRHESDRIPGDSSSRARQQALDEPRRSTSVSRANVVLMTVFPNGVRGMAEHSGRGHLLLVVSTLAHTWIRSVPAAARIPSVKTVASCRRAYALALWQPSSGIDARGRSVKATLATVCREHGVRFRGAGRSRRRARALGVRGGSGI